MIICILCDDANIANAREIAKGIGYPTALTIGVSRKGEAPATHWFCFLEGNDAALAKLNAANTLGEVEVSSPTQFLSKRNLKIIK